MTSRNFHINDTINFRTIVCPPTHSILISSNLFTCAMLYYTTINHITHLSPTATPPCNRTRIKIEVKWASGKNERFHSAQRRCFIIIIGLLMSSLIVGIRYQFGRCEMYINITNRKRNIQKKSSNNWKCAKMAHWNFRAIINQHNIINFLKSTCEWSWNCISLKLSLVKLLI